MSSKRVQNTHISTQLRDLHGAVLDIVGVINRPRGDDVMIGAAGISLERALFPLLVYIARFGPIGIVELADRVGRDYTTVSRQVTRLEELGLAGRRPAADRRVRQAEITPQGKIMTDAVDAARERLVRQMLCDWPPEEIAELVRLIRKFADAMLNGPAGANQSSSFSEEKEPKRLL